MFLYHKFLLFIHFDNISYCTTIRIASSNTIYGLLLNYVRELNIWTIGIRRLQDKSEISQQPAQGSKVQGSTVLGSRLKGSGFKGSGVQGLKVLG